MFWVIIVLLTLIVMALVILPMLRSVGGNDENERREQNIIIAQQELSDLEAEYASGSIEESAYKEAKADLEERLLEDINENDISAKGIHLSSKIMMVVLAIFIPAGALGMYAWLGSPDAIRLSTDPSANKRERTQEQMGSMDEMMVKLEAKLKSNPDNLEGWLMLGRSNMALSRFDKASESYGKAYELSPEDPDVMITYADALAAKENSKLTGKPEELILKALAKEPEHNIGLWLAGMAASQRGDNKQAVVHWTKLDSMMTGDSEERKRLRQMITASGGTVQESIGNAALAQQGQKAQAAQAPSTEKVKADPKAVVVTVTLNPALHAKTNPNEIVFIYAKAVSGPPMPLAAARHRVGDLPVTLKLDDAMAMIPQMKISGHQSLVVGARISKAGTPKAQPGDLYGELKPVALGSVISIDIADTVK